MRKIFWRGVLTGGAIGALLGMAVTPTQRPMQKAKTTGGRMRRRASRLWKDTRGELGAMAMRWKR